MVVRKEDGAISTWFEHLVDALLNLIKVADAAAGDLSLAITGRPALHHQTTVQADCAHLKK